MNLVETRGLSKQYGGGVLALQNLNLTIRRGEVFGLLGPNGAGKTTVLRLLTGFIKPTSGSATVAGGTPGSMASLAQVGAMIEAPAFWPYLSGRTCGSWRGTAGSPITESTWRWRTSR